MAQKYEFVEIPVLVRVKKPVNTTWTDQDIVNVLKIKSASTKDVKVLGHRATTPE